MLIFDRVTNWSVLRRLHPYRPDFGAGRGECECIDRFYIERFFDAYRHNIRGHVVEIGSDFYSRKYGGNQVTTYDVLDIDEKNDRRSITLDLQLTADAPEGVFDCILCPQTLFEIYDYHSAIVSLHKMLKAGGMLLVTVPGISQGVRGRMLGGAGNDWWRFTAMSARRIFAEVFGDKQVTIHTYGNVLTAVALLHGLVQGELTNEELEFHDPDYELVIGVASVKRDDLRIQSRD